MYPSQTGEVKETKLYKEDKNGKMKTETIKTITKQIQGKLRKISLCLDGKDECEFIEQDLLTKLILFRKNGLGVWKYEYKFDQNGNWTEKTEYEQVTKFGEIYFEPINIWKREITYYQ